MAKALPVTEFQDLKLSNNPKQALFKQIYEALRNKVLNGYLKPGTKLPSSRALAIQLKVSRNTVIAAFDQLLAEGYLESRTGSGTFVAVELPENWLPSPTAHFSNTSAASVQLSDYATHLDRMEMRNEEGNQTFCVGVPDLKAFPHKIWNRLSQQLPASGLTSLMGNGPAEGYQPLREAISDYVSASRSVQCDAQQIIITSGAQQALDLCARILMNPGQTAAIEEPGYKGARRALSSAGANIMTCPVDNQGLILETLKKSQHPPKLIYVTPAHQYPLGAMMPLDRRMELLDWAFEQQCWIIEDDYDSEYHYQSRPVASLQGLARQQQVIYMGSFSKVLFPSLRLGYLVLPPTLVEIFTKAKQEQTGVTPLHTQAVTAAFMQEGHFNRHLRRMRLNYEEKLKTLLEACEKLSPWCTVHAQGAGMHLALEFKPGICEGTVVRNLKTKNILCSPLSSYFYGKEKLQGLVLGFANSTLKEIASGVAIIHNVLKFPDG
ncbi:MocR-like pyridoxine biosynthesis transcription factor PdxR [Endozoicomonas numazuensis]|uniref:MocR-like pyridoxine biosynthesis transcription factor PdxR n=1 Tax=Endozoicomonas numazuensis TaxID=1137799 RepID=UPI0005584991|nr:PLP-dependent aminotransferase family protein [Endozoicomonas numazuensis]